MKTIVRLLILLLPFAFTGCGYIKKQSKIQNRDQHYLTARSVAPLKMPPGISSDAFHTSYPVSDRPFPEAAKQVSIVPPGLQE